MWWEAECDTVNKSLIRSGLEICSVPLAVCSEWVTQFPHLWNGKDVAYIGWSVWRGNVVMHVKLLSHSKSSHRAGCSYHRHCHHLSVIRIRQISQENKSWHNSSYGQWANEKIKMKKVILTDGEERRWKHSAMPFPPNCQMLWKGILSVADRDSQVLRGGGSKAMQLSERHLAIYIKDL